jgi:MFS family permease
VLADTLNRKKLIAITHTANILPGLILGLLRVSGLVQVWPVNAMNVLAGALQVLGGPARQAMIPGVVPQAYILNAVTMATLMMQGSQLTAPVIAGFLIDGIGVHASYFTGAALLVPSVICQRTFALEVAGGEQRAGARQRADGGRCVEHAHSARAGFKVVAAKIGNMGR